MHKGVRTSLTSKGVPSEIPKKIADFLLGREKGLKQLSFILGFSARKRLQPDSGMKGCFRFLGLNIPSPFTLPFSWFRFSSAEMIGVQSIPGCHGFLTLLSVFVSVSRPLPPPPRAPPRRKKLNL